MITQKTNCSKPTRSFRRPAALHELTFQKAKPHLKPTEQKSTSGSGIVPLIEVSSVLFPSDSYHLKYK